MSNQQQEKQDFAAQAASGQQTGIVTEFVDFLKDNKKWWLAPILAMLLLVGGLVVVGGSAVGPFLYALF